MLILCIFNWMNRHCAPMLLICETCHRHWKLPRGRERQDSCPNCQHRRRSRAAKARERLRRIVREGRLEAFAEDRSVTPDQLSQLIRDADSASARALATAQTIAARKA